MNAAGAARRLRRVFRPAPPGPSRAEKLRRIAARLAILSQRTDLRERALAALRQFGRTRSLRRISDIGLVAAEIFDADAGHAGRIDRYCRELTQAGTSVRSRVISAPRFAFVRGCLAFYTHDFKRAVQEFEQHAQREQTSRGAVAGLMIANWLRQSGFLQPAVIAALARNPAPAPDAKKSGRILLVVDGQPNGLGAIAERYCGSNEIVFVATLSQMAQELPRPPKQALAATADFWTSARGRDLRRRFDVDCFALADALARENSHLRGLAVTMADLARGRALPAWFLTATVADLVKRERFQRILVVTAWPLLFAAITQAATAGVFAPAPEAVWTARPRLEKGRFSFWPAQASVEAVWHARNTARLGVGGHCWSVAPPHQVEADTAVIGLRIGDENALQEARARLGNVLAQRPAIVFAQGDPRLLQRLRRPAARGLRLLRVYPAEMFAPPANAASWRLAAQAAGLARLRPRLLGERPERTALCEILLAGVVGCAAEIGMLAATVAWLDDALPADCIGFAGTNGAGSIWLAGFSEHLARLARTALEARARAAIDVPVAHDAGQSARASLAAKPHEAVKEPAKAEVREPSGSGAAGEQPERVASEVTAQLGEPAEGPNAIAQAEAPASPDAAEAATSATPPAFTSVAIAAKLADSEASRAIASLSFVPVRLEAAAAEPAVAESWRPVVMAQARRTPVERAAWCFHLYQKDRYADRAAAIVIALCRRGAVADITRFEALLPALFEDAVFDLRRMREYAHGLLDWKPQSALARNGASFAFVRAVAALYRHDFIVAEKEFAAYAQLQSGSPACICASNIANWLDIVPYVDPAYRKLLLVPASRPDMSNYANKNVLVLSEGTPAEIDATLAGAPLSAKFTIVLRYLHDEAAQPLAGRRYLFPDRYLWYRSEGKSVHTRLESICGAAGRRILALTPRLRTAPWSVRTYLIDAYVYDFVALNRFQSELASRSYDEVLIVTRRYSLFKTARALALRFLWPSHVNIGWLARPSMWKPPYFVYWPSRRDVANFLRGNFRAKRQRSKSRTAARALGPLPDPAVFADGERPAVLAWAVGDANYEQALHQVAAAVLTRRPLIVMAMGDTDDNVAAIEAVLSPLAQRSGHTFCIVRHAALMEAGRKHYPLLLKAVKQAVRSTIRRRWFGWRDADGVMAAVTRHDLADAFAGSPQIAAMAAGFDWLDQLLALRKPAYVISSPGRSAFPASVTEHLASSGVLTCDVHLYFLADQARQLKTPHDIIATVDSQVARFVSEYWGVDQSRIALIGYLWGERPPQGDVVPPPAANEPQGASQSVLYATQPSPIKISDAVLLAALTALADFPGVQLIVKPHPREGADAVARYHQLIGLHAPGRASVMPKEAPIGPMLDEADVVLTRTSNVGLQAAQRLKPLVRAVMHDKFLPNAFLEVPYAWNAQSDAALIEGLKAMLGNAAARARLRQQQLDYLTLNPSLGDGRGAERLIAFLESRIDASGPGSAIGGNVGDLAAPSARKQ